MALKVGDKVSVKADLKKRPFHDGVGVIKDTKEPGAVQYGLEFAEGEPLFWYTEEDLVPQTAAQKAADTKAAAEAAKAEKLDPGVKK